MPQFCQQQPKRVDRQAAKNHLNHVDQPVRVNGSARHIKGKRPSPRGLHLVHLTFAKATGSTQCYRRAACPSNFAAAFLARTWPVCPTPRKLPTPFPPQRRSAPRLPVANLCPFPLFPSQTHPRRSCAPAEHPTLVVPGTRFGFCEY